MLTNSGTLLIRIVGNFVTPNSFIRCIPSFVLIRLSFHSILSAKNGTTFVTISTIYWQGEQAFESNVTISMNIFFDIANFSVE